MVTELLQDAEFNFKFIWKWLRRLATLLIYIHEFNHVVPAELNSAIKKRCIAGELRSLVQSDWLEQLSAATGQPVTFPSCRKVAIMFLL